MKRNITNLPTYIDSIQFNVVHHIKILILDMDEVNFKVTIMYFHCLGFIHTVRHFITKWQYYNQNDIYADVLKYSNMGFTGMFSVETVLKIIAYGVKVSTQTQCIDCRPTHNTTRWKSMNTV